MFVFITLPDLDLTDMCLSKIVKTTTELCNQLVAKIKLKPVTDFFEIFLKLHDCYVKKRTLQKVCLTLLHEYCRNVS